MFQKASRSKLRFESAVGLLTSEDLWDLPLSSKGGACLDSITIALHRKLKEDGGSESFVVRNKAPGGQAPEEVLKLKFDIVTHVIDVKMAEADAADLAKANRDKKQRLLQIISEKENEKLMDSSLEELRAMAESL
jgi:hypothetical protein